MLLTLALLAGLVGALYLTFKYYASKQDKVWLNQGVHFVKLNQVASLSDRLSQRVSFVDVDAEIYRKFGESKFGGYVEFGTPILYLKDLDLVKHVLIKDFDHFIDRRALDLTKSDYFSRMLINSTGREWKDLRSIMTPTFSSGKIRHMFDLFNDCGDHLVKFLKEKSRNSNVIDFQDVFGRFTIGAISSVAFGQPTDTFEDDSTFRKMAKQISTPSGARIMRFIAYMLFPKLAKALGLTISDAESTQFFANIVNQNVKQRRAERDQGARRNDFLQLLLEAQAGQLKADEQELETFEKDALLKEDNKRGGKKLDTVLDDDSIIAQSILFFFAGSDTLESALTMIAYELALNPEVQEKLAGEIAKELEKTNGKLSYEAMNNIQYLDMVVSESLRLHPPVSATDRKCTKEYTVPGTNVRVPVDSRAVIPIRQIHHDAKYYPNPLKFNPENFSPQNKANRHPYAYLPFGQGPRNCIAMRFAFIEARAAIAHLVHNFRIEPSEKTTVPPTLVFTSGFLKPVNGMYLKFKIRDHLA